MSNHPAIIVLAAGGTGGHVFPAEALAAELLERHCRLILVTDRRGGVFGGSLAGIETHHIQAGGLAGKSWLARVQSVPQLALGTLQAYRLLKALAPDAAIGFGGYASIPTMMAASFGGFRTAIHEQNAVLGRANRLLARRVGRIATSFLASRALPADAAARVVHTGMPVRPGFSPVRDRPYPPLDEGSPIHLLVMGGSQGARVLSEVVPRAIGLLDQNLRTRLRIVQQCRPEDMEAAGRFYGEIGVAANLGTFFDDVPERLAGCHLLIGRSGASTVAELTAVGRPAILVPYPFAIDDHQSANAHAVDEVGAGWLMPQEAFTPETLSARLASLFGVPATLEKAAAASRVAGTADAARRLADVVFDLIKSNGRTEERRIAA